MTPKALKALQKLAALKAQRALGELAVARSRAAEKADRVSAAEAAIARSFDADIADQAAMEALRERLERSATLNRAAHRELLEQAREVERDATHAVARELGATALADAAAAEASVVDARRAERAEGVLTSLRFKPGRR